MVVEIPGTGDNPGDPKDPTSPDRVWNSMFDWVRKQMSIDQTRGLRVGFQYGGLLRAEDGAYACGEVERGY